MKESSLRDRVVDVAEELYKFSLLVCASFAGLHFSCLLLLRALCWLSWAANLCVSSVCACILLSHWLSELDSLIDDCTMSAIRV